MVSKPRPADLAKITVISREIPEVGRRSLLQWIFGVLAATIAAVIAGGAGRFALFSSSQNKIREIPPDAIAKLERDKPFHSPEAGAWLIKDSKDKVTAFDDRCTHLGCRHKWNPELKLFQCPCHGSEFDVYGMVKRGPATTPLAKLTIDDTDKTRIKLVAS